MLSMAAHRIAVVRLDNLGDHVLGAGLFGALRSRCPRSRLVAVVSAPVAELYARCPALDTLVTLPSPSAYLNDSALWARVLHHLSGIPKFDVVVNPRFAEDYYAAGAICSAIAAPQARVVGFRQARSPIAGYEPNGFYKELLEAPATLHTAKYADLVATAVMGRAVTAPPEVWFQPADWIRVSQRLGLVSRSYVAVGIGASFAFKRPSLDIYRRVLTRLLAEPGPVVLIGTAQESAHAEALRAMLPESGRVVLATGSLRLYELAALLRHARLYVGPDAGPKHMAAASRTPVVEIAWVPADHPATSRGNFTGGLCWNAWNTVTRVVYPSREVFDRSLRDSQFPQRPISGIDPSHIDRAIDELLGGQAERAEA